MSHGNPSASNPVPTVYAAVYTRKSTEEGLEQEFNSLDAQREAGEAYIASQRSQGWVLVGRTNTTGPSRRAGHSRVQENYPGGGNRSYAAAGVWP